MNENFPLVVKEIAALIRENKPQEISNFILNAVDADSSNIDAIFKFGIACAQNNRFEVSILIFNCLLSRIKDDIKIPYNLGLIYALRGDYQLALESYDFALKIKPDDLETLINKASVCNDLKNYRYGLDILENAIKIRSDIPEAWLNKGIALNNLNLYLESISAYDEALKIDLSFYQAWSNKSIPLNRLKRFLEASESCDKALSLKPDYAEAYANKGDALSGLQRYEEALRCYDKALSLRPEYAEVFSSKGVVLRELKSHEEALRCYDKALSLKPDYAEAYANKGDALSGLQRYEEALRCYDKALSLKPNEADFFYQKSLVNISLNQFENATENLKKAIENNFKKVGHAEYVLSALNPEIGLKPMPKDFVAEIFDGYADYFDKHLTETLKYRIPDNLLELLDLSFDSRLTVLDIGCGTGLMGALLKPYASKIIGVDVSKEMLLKAELTGAYASLIAEDVGDFLNTTKQQFDLIVAADVFIYIGELNSIFMNSFRVLADGGLFCFSIERSDVERFSLSPKTLRFSHSRQYIENLANFYNFTVKDFRDVPIRKENHVDVDGYIFLLQKA